MSAVEASVRPTCWLKAREHAFFLGLIAPVLLLLAVFFLTPVLAMLTRSLEPAPGGVRINDVPLQRADTSEPRRMRLPTSEIGDANGDGRIDPADVVVRSTRTLALAEVDAARGLVTLAADAPPTGLLTLPSASGRQVLMRVPGEVRVLRALKRGVLSDLAGEAIGTLAVEVETEGPPQVLDLETGTVLLSAVPSPSDRLTVSYMRKGSVTLENYKRIFSSSLYFNPDLSQPSILKNTLSIAIFSTLGCILLGYPLSYVMANGSGPIRAVVLAFIMIPLWTSILVRTFAWQLILGKTGFVNYLLLKSGISSEPLSLVFNRFGVYVGMIHVLLPFFVLPAFAAMQGIPRFPRQAATSLGANPLQSFIRIYLPLSLPGVAAGAIIVFIVSLGFFVTPALLGSGGDRMLSNLIETQFGAGGNWGFAAALSFLLLVPTALLYALYARISEQQTGRRAAPGAASRAIRFGLGERVSEAAVRAGLSANARMLLLLAAAALALLWASLAVYEAPPLLIGVIAGLVAAAAGLFLLFARVPVRRSLLYGVCAILCVFLILPNFIVIPISFGHHPVFISFPGEGFTLENYASFFGVGPRSATRTQGWLPAAWTSLKVAVLVTLIAVPLGTLAAYGLVRGQFPGRRVATYLILLPLIVPSLVNAVALYLFYARYMPFMLGAVTTWGIELPLGFIVAHSLLAIPYVVIIVTANLRGVDPTLERAAMNLGAGRLTVFRKVVVPLIVPGMLASAFFSFLISFDELILSLFLSTPGVTTLPKRLWDGVKFEVDPTIAAVSTMLVLLTLVTISVAALVQLRAGRAA